MDSLWSHTVFYYRYNSYTYQKFPIDLWEDVCAWLNGTTNRFLLKWISQIISKYSNLNHSCPYYQVMEVEAERLKLNNFLLIEQLLPSGKYRGEINLTRGYKKEPIAIVKFFFSISDNRIDKF